MNLTILGATGATGKHLIQLAVDAGHSVVVLVRTPEKLGALQDRVTVVQGDVTNAPDVTKAITRQTDAVLSALGAREPFAKTPITVHQIGISNALGAMGRSGVRRIVAVSASGIHTDANDNLVLRVAKVVLRRVFANLYADLSQMERELRASDSDWSVVVAPQLTDKRPVGRYRLAVDRNVTNAFKITRADLARAMLDIVVDRSTFRAFTFVAN